MVAQSNDKRYHSAHHWIPTYNFTMKTPPPPLLFHWSPPLNYPYKFEPIFDMLYFHGNSLVEKEKNSALQNNHA